MAKIDFTNAEKEIERNLRRMFITNLIKMTEDEQAKEKLDEDKAHNNKNTLSILKSMQKDLGRLSEKSDEMWKALGVTKDEINNYIKNPGKLSKDEWDNIKELMKKIKEYKQSAGSGIEEEINDEIIQSELKRHKDKRINVNERWKPI